MMLLRFDDSVNAELLDPTEISLRGLNGPRESGKDEIRSGNSNLGTLGVLFETTGISGILVSLFGLISRLTVGQYAREGALDGLYLGCMWLGVVE